MTLAWLPRLGVDTSLLPWHLGPLTVLRLQGKHSWVHKATLGSVLPRCFLMSAVWPCAGMLCTHDKSRYCVAQSILRAFFFFFFNINLLQSSDDSIEIHWNSSIPDHWNQNSNLGPSAQYLFPVLYFPHCIWSLLHIQFFCFSWNRHWSRKNNWNNYFSTSSSCSCQTLNTISSPLLV